MENRPYRWLMLIACVFVATLIISNIIAVKLIRIAGLTLPAAIILFPITYIIGDVLTEVYGYAKARQVIWLGFLCNLVAELAIWIAGLLPPAPFWTARFYNTPAQAEMAYHAILSFSFRLLTASFIAYLAGEFLNSFVLAKLKLKTKGRFLWMRTIGSTIVGQGADSTIFISVAFLGILPAHALGITIISQWLFKVAYEAAATPLTYIIVNALKRSEGVDRFDSDTNFNPLKIFRVSN